MVSFEEVNAHFANRTLAQAWPFPPQPFSRQDTARMLDISTQVAQCFLGDPAEDLLALFPQDEHEDHEVRQVASDLIKRDLSMKERIAKLPDTKETFTTREGDRFASTWQTRGAMHNTRLMLVVNAIQSRAWMVREAERSSLQLMFHPAAEDEMYTYITDVARRMLKASRVMATIHGRLFIGWRGFNDEHVTAWQRANVSSRRGVRRWYKRLISPLHHSTDPPRSQELRDCTSALSRRDLTAPGLSSFRAPRRSLANLVLASFSDDRARSHPAPSSLSSSSS